MSNNEIKLDKKATRYLKDNIGGGGSGEGNLLKVYFNSFIEPNITSMYLHNLVDDTQTPIEYKKEQLVVYGYNQETGETDYHEEEFLVIELDKSIYNSNIKFIFNWHLASQEEFVAEFNSLGFYNSEYNPSLFLDNTPNYETDEQVVELNFVEYIDYNYKRNTFNLNNDLFINISSVR